MVPFNYRRFVVFPNSKHFNKNINLYAITVVNKAFIDIMIQLSDKDCTTVNVGRSTSDAKRTKVMVVNEGYICPKTVDKHTWVGGQSHNDKFGIKQIGKIVQITRTDSNRTKAHISRSKANINNYQKNKFQD